MSYIQIGKIITSKRKEKGLTQEELANYLGVSKPAVSKWESGQSYPDILLLPELAAYFDISIDQLIGYEPQMTKEEVNKLYNRLAEEYAKGPFQKTYKECEEYIRKYFSCWYLQLKMALLYVNHCNLAGTPDDMIKVIERALEIFERVEKSSDDVTLVKLALQLKAFCYLNLNKPAEAIDILKNLSEPFMQSENLLVNAYQMKGDMEKAIEHLQGYTFINLMSIIGAASDYFMMYAGQPERMEQFYKIFCNLCDLFQVEELHPAMLIKLRYAAAQSYLIQGKKEEALNVLEQYVSILNKCDQGKFTLHGSRIFDALDRYIESSGIETTSPRNSEIIWRELKDSVLNNPALAALESEERFQRIKKRLEV